MTRRIALMASAAALTLALAEGSSFAANPKANPKANQKTADCLNASDAALKLGNQHKLRAERAQLLTCAATSCPADIRKECLRLVDEVNGQIPTIVFSAKDGTGADLSAVKVTMDDEVLAQQLDGTAVPIDPGEHTFTFESAGQPPVTKKLVIVEGQKDRRELVVIGKTDQPTSPPATAGSTESPASEAPANPGRGMGTQKVLALVAGGIGVVGLGVGTVFGIMALSKKSDAQNACSNACPTQDGVNKWSDATSTGNISTIALIVGGVGVVGGAVLWFTAPSGSSSTPQVGVGPGGLQLRGRW
jgi:hypothetical protein